MEFELNSLTNTPLLKNTPFLTRYVQLQYFCHATWHPSLPSSCDASVLLRLWRQRSVEQCLGWCHFRHRNDTQWVGKLMRRLVQNVHAEHCAFIFPNTSCTMGRQQIHTLMLLQPQRDTNMHDVVPEPVAYCVWHGCANFLFAKLCQ